MILKTLLTLTAATLALGQRPFFAGSKPIGYPEITTSTVAPGLDNKFGEGDSPTTTQRLPLEALGDKDLVDRLSKLPVDKQPFWFINWQALEAHRKNPQSYPQRPSSFIVGTQAASNFDFANTNVNPISGNVSPVSGNVGPVSGNVNPTNGNVNTPNVSANPVSGNINSESGSLSNRNGGDSNTTEIPSIGLLENNSGSKKPSSVASSPHVDRIGAQYIPGNKLFSVSAKPITEKLPIYQNQGNQNKAQHTVNYYNGYGYF